jgi:ABC-type sugar transport system ATPase subunit
VLDIPSLHLRGHRTTAILGPNGSGKTTLLRLLAGLEVPLSGRVGLPIGAGPVHHRVAFVFQEHVFLRRSVRENLALGLTLRGVPPRERDRRIAEAADLLRISEILDRRADRLSGGERSRASLARALCLRAPLVLLDEPLAGLDHATYARLLDELPHLLEAFGATTLLVTHNRDEALRLAEDLVVLIDGRVHAAGDKRDVARHPTDRAAAEVLGYVILSIGGRPLAVRPGDLRPGPGRVAFALTVDGVLDVVDRREVVGRIGDVRVHVTMDELAAVPERGATIRVHALHTHAL